MEFRDAILGATQAAPSTPAAGTSLLYTKSDELWYSKGSDGVEHAMNKAPTRQILTVGSGTYTTPTGCVAIDVEVQASGAGGGGAAQTTSQMAVGAGGGAGGYARKLIAAPAATYAYTVGAKGTGGAAGNNAGIVGNDSTFGAGGGLITAKGGSVGSGGAAGTAIGSQRGGIATANSTGGDINIPGAPGGPAIRLSASAGVSGFGGPSFFGGGGRARDSTEAVGDAGNAPGSGGGGGVCAGTTARAGGDGVDGTIIVTEYY